MNKVFICTRVIEDAMGSGYVILGVSKVFLMKRNPPKTIHIGFTKEDSTQFTFSMDPKFIVL